jgi:hypothetical protein
MRLSEEEFTRELRALRPAPAPDFAAKLDRRAAEGFPRRSLRPSWLASRQQLIPVLGAASLFVVVAGIAVGQSGLLEGSDEGGPVMPTAVETSGTGQLAEPKPAPAGGALERRAQAQAGSAAEEQTFSAPLSHGGGETFDRLNLAGAAGRKQAQRVNLGLATAPEDFRAAADGVFDVVRDHRGFVESSNVSGGDPDVPGASPGHATYELRIPTGQLSAALADLSNLGHVVSRTDGTIDITHRFTSAENRIGNLKDQRARLLDDLSSAATLTEQQAIHRQLRSVHRALDAARHDIAEAQQRVRLTPVSVTIDSDEAVAGGGGTWGIDDALRDAGDVLVAMAGALLIAGAVLVPLVLLSVPAWLAWRVWRHRRREQALDVVPGGAG